MRLTRRVKMTALSFFLVLSFFLTSCDGDKEKIPNYDAPYDLHVTKVANDKINLVWSYRTQSNKITYVISRKAGDEAWNDNYHQTNNDERSFFDDIPTNSHTVYSYRVKAKDIDNETVIESYFSNPASFFPDVTMPTNLNITQIAQNKVKLSWNDNVVGEAGYKIDKKIDNNNWLVNYASLSENSNEFIDEINQLYTNVSYRVYAFVGSSTSPSNSISFTPTIQIPNDLLLSQSSQTQVNISWNYSGDEPNFFDIQRKIGTNDWQDIKRLLGTFLSYDDTPMLEAGTISYRIRAVKDTLYSGYSEEKMINFNINELSSVNLPDNGISVIHYNSHIFIANNYSGVQIYNVNNPMNPVHVKNIQVQSKTTSIDIDNNILYVLNDEGILQRYNISVISNPFKLDNDLSIPGQGNYLKIVNINNKKYALVASGTAGLSIITLDNQHFPYPIVVKIINTVGNSVNFDFKDNKVYLADSNNGLLVYDLNDPLNPTLIDHINTAGNINYVKIQNDYIYLAKGSNGISVLNRSTHNTVSQMATLGYVKSIFTDNRNLYIANSTEGFKMVSALNPQALISLCHIKYDEKVNDVFVRNKFAYLVNDSTFKIIQVRP